MVEFTIGGSKFETKAAGERPSRWTGLIWGASGVGKTTLAATMPGKKLIVLFDPDGDVSVANAPDVEILDLSGTRAVITTEFKKDDPFGLAKIGTEFDSIIIDSITSAEEKALSQGIDITKGAIVERPSPGAYQARNNLVLNLIRNVLSTVPISKHVCFLAHEAEQRDDNRLLAITLALGGKLPAQAPIKVNEVWCLFDTSTDKRIIIRKNRMREPIKTRMFKTSGAPEFVWKFNPETWEGMTIADWYEKWAANGFRKIDLPA